MKRAGQSPVTIFVAPFRGASRDFAGLEPAAIVLIRDPERSNLSLTILQDLFGSTGSEAAVASLLATGRSVDQIATMQGVSRNTARTHLKNILVKAGTNRQAALVGLLLQSVAVLGALPR